MIIEMMMMIEKMMEPIYMRRQYFLLHFFTIFSSFLKVFYFNLWMLSDDLRSYEGYLQRDYENIAVRPILRQLKFVTDLYLIDQSL